MLSRPQKDDINIKFALCTALHPSLPTTHTPVHAHTHRHTPGHAQTWIFIKEALIGLESLGLKKQFRLYFLTLGARSPFSKIVIWGGGGEDIGKCWRGKRIFILEVVCKQRN